MKYTRKVIDLESGKPYWLDFGDTLPISDVASRMGTGPLRFRQLLTEMGILQKEYDEVAEQHRRRLAPWAVNSGLGFRHDNRGFFHDPDRSPFDVLTPDGVEYVRDHLEEAQAKITNASDDKLTTARRDLGKAEARRLSQMTPEMRVAWLGHFYPDLTAREMGVVIGASESLVCRYQRRRHRQLGALQERRDLASSKSNESPATPCGDDAPLVHQEAA